jgi:hypothetical protein
MLRTVIPSKCNCWGEGSKVHLLQLFVCIHHRHFVCTGYEKCQKSWSLDWLFRAEHFLFWQNARSPALSASLSRSALSVWLHPFPSFKWSQPTRQSDKRPSININWSSVHGSGPGLERLSLAISWVAGLPYRVARLGGHQVMETDEDSSIRCVSKPKAHKCKLNF